MTATARWEDTNAAYLSASLAWLRLLLQRHAQAEADAASQPHTVTSAEVEDAAAALEAVVASSPVAPALPLLGARLGLSRFEREVLLLCVAMELDTGISALCALAHGDAQRSYPTFALALALFAEPSWDALLPDRPLRYWHLVELHEGVAPGLVGAALQVDEWVVHEAKGAGGAIDERLAPLTTVLHDAVATPLAESQAAVAARIERDAASAAAHGRPAVFQLLGWDTRSKQAIAAHAAAALGCETFRLPAALLPSQPSEVELVGRLWQRRSLLHPSALYVDASEPPEGGAGASALALSVLLASAGPLCFLDTATPEERLDDAEVIEEASPTGVEQRAAWRTVLGSAKHAGRLASQFDLAIADIVAIGRHAASGAADRAELWERCRAHTRPRLGRLAQRLDPRASWDDLVLPEQQLSQLRQIAAQITDRGTVYDDWGFRDRGTRGLGISVLFAGESGTGKTMAAEVIANALSLDLYRIDLSTVVSKYIGETEKHLRQVFDGAERGGAILLFDEADALFGKRTEVKDSHDRYANIEVSYLLQRMEAYRGLAILATNMKTALDSAFLRRLRVVVDFPFPAVAQRRALWQRALPARTPTGPLDHDHLARLDLAGGSIANIALNAAFLAASAGTPVTMPLLLEAARAEFAKHGRSTEQAVLRWPRQTGAVA
jgi:hypothetical protein